MNKKVRALIEKAESGDAVAQFDLARSYHSGFYVELSFNDAVGVRTYFILAIFHRVLENH